MTEDKTSSKQDLRESIADYLAGDLSEIENQQFEELLRTGAIPEQDQAFWEKIQPALSSHGRPTEPTSKIQLAQVIRKRLSEATEIESVSAPTSATHAPAKPALAFPQWLRYLAAAAAAALITLAVFPSPSPSTPSAAPKAGPGQVFVAYNEHGDAIYAPQPPSDAAYANLYGGKYLPYHQVEHLDASQAQTAGFTPKIARPYLGLLVKPITLDNSDQESGALVLQVFGDSPAEKAGIKPGDVLLLLAECPMATSHCIPGALKGKSPGDKIDVIYLDQETNTVNPISITLGATYE